MSEHGAYHEIVLVDPTALDARKPDVFTHHAAGNRIALMWIARLRWLAIVGQLAAVFLTYFGLGLVLPLGLTFGVIASTAITNLALVMYLRSRVRIEGWLVPFTLMLDIALLTALLATTGGPANPFCELYLVHVGMAVVVLRPFWTWLIAGFVAVCYAVLLLVYLPFQWRGDDPSSAMGVGAWIAMALSAVLIVYFLGRLRTTLRAREQQVAAMRDVITRDEQLTSLAALAAGAAHELGTPLGTIAIVAHELQREASDAALPKHVLEDIALIRQEVDRCRRILDRMNVEDWREHDEAPHSTPVPELLAALETELGSQAFARLQTSVDSRIESVDAPCAEIVQALQILIQNAIDATDAADAAATENEPIDLRIERNDDGRIFIEVEDRGVGMSRDQLQRAGEPFRTTKSPARGMGLGLFLVRQIAEHWRCRLIIRSRAGEGVSVRIEFLD